ncbi:unnamed protein product [Dicrocoelium dendriticum]|nr:unnamed protein product [Dicrocoelium dendriticum]
MVANISDRPRFPSQMEHSFPMSCPYLIEVRSEITRGQTFGSKNIPRVRVIVFRYSPNRVFQLRFFTSLTNIVRASSGDEIFAHKILNPEETEQPDIRFRLSNKSVVNEAVTS